MDAKELRARLRMWPNDGECVEFSHWWWYEHMDKSARSEWIDKYGCNDDIREDLSFLDDEELMFLWAVFKM